MIGLALIAAAAAGYWAWKTREERAMRFGDVAAVVAALIALKLFTKGDVAPALLALGGAGWWYWFRSNGGAPARRVSMTRRRASELLEIPADASPDEIRSAHRRLVARVHPDLGGSADLTAQVNAARDALLNPHRR